MIATSLISVINVNDGEDGTGLSNTVVEYCIGEDGQNPPGNPIVDEQNNPLTDEFGQFLTDGNWSSTIPDIPPGYFLWTRTILYFSDEDFQISYSVSQSAVSVLRTVPEYRLSDSSTEMSGSGVGYTWSETKPEIEAGQYIWERQRTELSDGTYTYSSATCDVTISGVLFDVSQNKNAITNKVWQTDMEASINEYDQSTTRLIRDRVTQTEQDIDGIHTQISDIQSDVETKADGSTVTQIEQRVHTVEDTTEGHTREISSVTATLSSGSQNILLNSSFSEDLKLWTNSSNRHEIVTLDGVKCGHVVGTTGSSGTGRSLAQDIYQRIKSDSVGQHYTISADINLINYTPGATNPYLALYLTGHYDNNGTSAWMGATYVGGTVPNAGSNLPAFNNQGWVHVTYTFRFAHEPTDMSFQVFVRDCLCDLYYKNIKMERGDIATTWTPSTDEVVATKTIAEQTADKFTWLVEGNSSSSSITLTENAVEAITNQFIIKDNNGSSTIISGGQIVTGAITTAMLATDAIKSSNYQALSSNDAPYSYTGTFLDLTNGNFWTPNFGVINSTPTGTNIPLGAWFNGNVNATSGHFGTDSCYWNIENVVDYGNTVHAALVGTGSPYLQTGNWQVSDNAVSTRQYSNSGSATGVVSYFINERTLYDVGMKIPTKFAQNTDTNVEKYERSFFYARKYIDSNQSHDKPLPPVQDSLWDYFFMVDNDGNIYENGVPLNQKYAEVGSSAPYLPRTGGIIDGNLELTGTFTNTTTKIQTNLESTSSASFTGANTITPGVTGTLPVGNGGTGQTTAQNAANYLIDNLDTENGNLADAYYFIGSGQTASTYYRRPMSSLWNYVKGKIDSVYNISAFDGEFADITTGSLIVTGAARFSGNIYGSLSNSLVIKLNGGTTEGTNQFTYNGGTSKTVNITKSSLGLDKVENTALSGWEGSSSLTTTSVGTLGYAATKGVDTSIDSGSQSGDLPTSGAVASFVEGKNYRTGSGTNGHLVSWGSNNALADSGLEVNGLVTSVSVSNDMLTVVTSDGVSHDYTINITGQVVSGATILTDAQGKGISVGGSTRPVYFVGGIPVEANYIPKLNNSINGGTFYAPTSSGTAGHILKSNGSSAPIWINPTSDSFLVGKATKDADGNTISTTYLKASNGVATNLKTNKLIIEQATTIAQNNPADLHFITKQTDNNKTSNAHIYVYDDHDAEEYGTNMVILPSGNLFAGGGESALSLYREIGLNSTGENAYLTADGTVYIEASCNAVNGVINPDRKGFAVTTNHNIVPTVAETTTNDVGSIGTSSCKWAHVYATTLHGSLDGNATTATTAVAATNDSAGNEIASTYVKLAGAQTISGAKTFSALTSFTNTTASGRMTANEVKVGDVVMQYDSGAKCLNFVFN